MGRTPDPTRKPELLAQILDYVATEPLSRMTFRSLASALGVSTYSFVYHFGSRREMIDAILEESVRLQREVLEGVDVLAFDRDQLVAWYKEAFRYSLRDANRTGLRLQFEAGSLESVDPDIGRHMTDAFASWLRLIDNWLIDHGVEADRASTLANWISDTTLGLHFGYLMTGNRERTIAAFDVFIEAFMRAALDS
ncbi:TetR/AcrR family transcriptional regulator [Diaminobutyricibacter sp. McL0608]|uniref:TetR/AcrR family transcriptional regulator n=1 Tax=Leifsonia sp. McL0608 TaxID=3143537 RepID=UPI0031F313ED